MTTTNQKPTSFIHSDFLLNSVPARRLYHEVAEGLPIIDYHSHLSPTDLAADRRYETITDLWITEDPYKHRAMRLAGVPEALITGSEPTARERFNAWAATVPKTLGNPLFHWSALELKRTFGIDELLSPASADGIWDQTQACLRGASYSARQLLAQTRVACVCTSDQMEASLDAHAELARSSEGPRIVPSLRDPHIVDHERFDRFAALGCRIADHAVEDSHQLDSIRPLAAEYKRRGWTLLLHLGALRDTSSRLRKQAGPTGGFASIGNSIDVKALCHFLNNLEKENALPRTILFPLNPVDYPALATLTGSFTEDGVPGKLQLGPAWWYNDHALGIRQHLDVLSHYGLLSTFVGMTTDSRSLLSMSRHEYFRRVLCDYLGTKILSGELPDSDDLMGPLVTDICYTNAHTMLNQEPPHASTNE